MPNEKYERERILIESSILAVTLLFVIAGVRGLTENPVFVGILSLDGLLFMLAAASGVVILFLKVSPRGLWSAVEVSCFIAGLLATSFILAALAIWGIGLLVPGSFFGVYIVVGVVDSALLIVGFVYFRQHLRRRDHTTR